MMMLMTLTGLRSISEILGVLLILDCVLFVLKFFTKQLFFMISYLKSIAINSPNSDFCDKYPGSVTHIFCNCDLVWDELFKIIKANYDIDFTASNFDTIFGAFGDNFLTYLFLCLKSHLLL